MRRAVIISLAIGILSLGIVVSAETPEREMLLERIQSLQGEVDKANPSSPEAMELQSLFRSYNAAVREGAPPNDACANAIPIGCNTTVPFDTTGATTDAPWSCAGGGSDIWYVITGNGGLMTFDTCTGTGYDSALSAYTGACGGFVEVACNDDTCGLQSQISFVSTAGTDYFIAVGGFLGGTGTGQLTVTCEVPVELQTFDVE